MASILKRGNKWRALVTKSGTRTSATFSTKAEAVNWAIKVEAEIVSGEYGGVTERTVRDMFDRYLKEIATTKKGYRWELLRLNMIGRGVIGGVKLNAFDETHVYDWKRERMTQVSEASVRREWEIMSAVCTVAAKQWKWIKVNPFLNVPKPKQSKARDRIITNDEIEKLLFALGCSDDVEKWTQTRRVGMAFQLAIETAMRAGEITKLTWDRVFEKHVHIDETKSGHPRDVPLSKRAREILSIMPRDYDTVFGISTANLDAMFRKAKAKVMIDDVHFHDTRHTALTRLASKLDVMTLAKMSGHRDVRVLLNVYYNPKMADFADALG